MYGFVRNDGTNYSDYLGMKCYQTANSFKWINEPKPIGYGVTFDGIGRGVMVAKSLTIVWVGEADIECCCFSFTGNLNSISRKKGEMAGYYKIDNPGNNIMIPGGSPLPAAGINPPKLVADALKAIIKQITSFALSPLDDLPGLDRGAIRNAKIDLDQVYHLFQNEKPDAYIWTNGWPCD